MVSKGETLGPRPDVRRDGKPRKKPGPQTLPEDVRAERLVVRVHPDLFEILTKRSRERGFSRSLYVEKILLGYVALDPRNPKLDEIGKKIPDAMTGDQLRLKFPMRFAAAWQKFASLSQALIGLPPRDEWLDRPGDVPGEFFPPEQEEPDPAAAKWAAGVKAKSEKGE
jgi:hypothetical protein